MATAGDSSECPGAQGDQVSGRGLTEALIGGRLVVAGVVLHHDLELVDRGAELVRDDRDVVQHGRKRLPPAGGFDVGHSSGIYVGNWNSNVDSAMYNGANLEMDFYGGYKHAFEGGFGQAVLVVRPASATRESRNQAIRAWVQATRIGLDAFSDQETLVAWASDLADGRPLALYDVGASAGLNLNIDRYRIEIGDRVVGPADGSPVIACRRNVTYCVSSG